MQQAATVRTMSSRLSARHILSILILAIVTGTIESQLSIEILISSLTLVFYSVFQWVEVCRSVS